MQQTDHRDHRTGDTAGATTSAEARISSDRDGDEQSVIDRVLRRSGEHAPARVFGHAQALQERGIERSDADDEIALERASRHALQHVDGLSTELEDITEVEYRQVRLERVVLIGVYEHGSRAEAENSLSELAALAATAGAKVLDGVLQRRPNPDPATYLGRGKVAELRDLVASLGADTVVADTELAPSQRRALEDAVRVKVIDRTTVILDIFAQHAKSREGKAQVELAQLEYLLPRLRGWGASMSRQAGGQVGSAGAGMGSRGPGETKIELDRRRIHTRMARLRRSIATMKVARDTRRERRHAHRVPAVAIVGYTNAGKSSLLNRITDASVLVENQLFATLDATVRRTRTRAGRPFTLTDTVGFVRNLPHQLVEAFRSTLEEADAADVLVHVVDASHPDPAAQLRTVHEVLAEIGARDIPEIVVFNKADLIDEARALELRGIAPDAVLVSARTGAGVDAALARIEAALPRTEPVVEMRLPYDRGDLLARLRAAGGVLAEDHDESGMHVTAYVDPDLLGEVEPYRIAGAHAPIEKRPRLKHRPSTEPAEPVAERPEPSLPRH